MVRKYIALLRMKYIEMLAYRLATFVWMTGAITQPLITMFVWMNIHPEESESFLFYFMAVIFVERMTSAWDVWELDREIREGTFSNLLLRPLHPIHWAIAENIVYKWLFLVILVPVWMVGAVCWPALRPHMTGSQIGWFLGAVVLGAALRFLLSYSCGLLAFWVTKVAAVYGVIDVISLFLSGRIAPLEMLPPQLREWSEWLPFRYMISFPIEIATGAVRAEELVRGFAIAAGWLFVLAAVLQWLWKAGMKKNQAVGG
ncbi:ABC-2 family transporter protein [Geobacillus thermodenitrificans]|jgi:ABC-2 type transport system permease protein|uniref:ABC-2 family transporter protein n=1 Tax=Geobacillus thermodenitrificans TaxID=33940 RepID=A0ABY9QFJ7_GEOTD|nr:ABC-2 family transporter protein [Geobacillus thermodenitrificans]ATO36208.1 multidrug ABC transporter permease [Geobacillus thermodenitrificans]WMV77659.1 ABC-2 family transporter protein [Geobacillus thermodenitrificans]